MTRPGRAVVLAVSLSIVVFAAIGGFMGRAMAARDEGSSYEHLRIFEDVVSLISNNYVEDVDIDKVMHGAMHGLADGLDPDSAYLDAKQVGQVETKESLGSGQTGIELTRQYYLRVIAARDGSPAAKAGLQPGDYIRAHRRPVDPRHLGVRRHAAAARQAGYQGAAHRAARQRRGSARRGTDPRRPAGAGREGPHRRARDRVSARARVLAGHGGPAGGRGSGPAEVGGGPPRGGPPR